MMDLKAFFTAARIRQRIESAPPVKTTVMDRLFPAESRQQHDQPLIPISEIVNAVGTAPVVRRGGGYVNIDGGGIDNVYIEPLPVRLESKLSATELNNLKIANPETKEAWASRKTLNMRKTARLTTEALCAQAGFNGEIKFALLEDSGSYATYTVSYGSQLVTVTVAAETKWNHAEMDLLKVYNFLDDLSTKSDEGGYGGDKITHAGAAAFAQLLSLADKQKDKPTVPFQLNKDGSISVGGHVIHKMAETYVDPATGKAVKKLADDEIRMNATGGTGFFYGPVDDLDANLQPLPMFTKVVKHPTRGHLILGESKPLPCIAPKSIIKAKVLS